MTVSEVRRLLALALPLPVRSVALQVAWSDWRRRQRWLARQSHYRARARRALMQKVDTS